VPAARSNPGSPSVVEVEALAQEGLAEKTIDHHNPCSTLAVGTFDTTVMMEENDSTALLLAKSDKSNVLRRVEEDGPGTIFGVLIVDLHGMGGESKAEAARRQMEAVHADEAAMDRLRAELRHEDEKSEEAGGARSRGFRDEKIRLRSMGG